MRVRIFRWLALLILASTGLRAQDLEAPVPVGSIVRVEAAAVAAGRIEGMVSATDSGSLTVHRSGRTPLRVPLDAIQTLERQTGQSRQVVRGAVIGTAAGLLGGILYTRTGAARRSEAYEAGYANLVFPSLGTVAGAGLGAGIGALCRTTTWSPVMRDRIRISAAPRARRGFSVSAAVEF